MDFIQFWRIIEKTRQGNHTNLERYEESLAKNLRSLTPEEIIGFDAKITELTRRAYRWNLWDAAYLINGGCSDDGFSCFRLWLIAQGKQVYEEALLNPDLLADYINVEDEECEFEAIISIAWNVWSERTGRSVDEFPVGEGETGGEPVGKSFIENDPALAMLLPKLYQKFG